jgi:hypothetical protein
MHALHSLPLPLWLAVATLVVLLIVGAALYRRIQRPAARPPVRFGGGSPDARKPDDPRAQRPNQQ